MNKLRRVGNPSLASHEGTGKDSGPKPLKDPTSVPSQSAKKKLAQDIQYNPTSQAWVPVTKG